MNVLDLPDEHQFTDEVIALAQDVLYGVTVEMSKSKDINIARRISATINYPIYKKLYIDLSRLFNLQLPCLLNDTTFNVKKEKCSTQFLHEFVEEYMKKKNLK